MKSSHPWCDGLWHVKDINKFLVQITGSKYEYKGMIVLDYPDSPSRLTGTLVAGEFEETPDDVREASGGVEKYNLQFQSDVLESFHGVLTDNGTRIILKSFITGKVEVMMWMNEEKLKEMRENRDDVNAPTLPSYYKIQPEKKGKLIWFTGPPGSGKSTCAQLMGRNHGYIYYEGDAFFSFVNPYIDVHVENPSFAALYQKPLKGIPTNLIKMMTGLGVEQMMQGNFEFLKSMVPKVLPAFAERITQQRHRVGGDFATAWALISSREQRDLARSCFGGEVIFLVLNMTKECQRNRIEKRQGKGKAADPLFMMYDLYEPASEDEVNSFNVTVTEDMSPDDVIAEVLNILGKLS